MKTIIIFILSFAIFEFSLRMHWISTSQQLQNIEAQKFISIKNAFQHQPKMYQDFFCDPIHQNKNGEMHFAQCIRPLISTFNLSDPKIALGASTTHGFNCNSNTSWPIELEQLNSNIKIKNFAEDGQYSDESIIKLNKTLHSGYVPKLVIWAHGITEFLYYGDERDINHKELINKLKINSQKEKFINYRSNFLLKILRLDITLQKYILSYQFFRNFFDKLVTSNVADGYIKYVALQIGNDEGNDMNGREAFVTKGGFLGGPSRNLFSKTQQDYGIENYKINLRRLYELSSQYHFQVVCVRFPHVSNLLSFYSPDFGKNFDAWISKANQVTQAECIKYNFKIADIEACYNELLKSY